MKKLLSCTALIFMVTLNLAAGEPVMDNGRAAFGLGAEANMNSRENFAGGASLGFDCSLRNPAASWALGFWLGVSSNSTAFDGIIAIEPAGLFRWYFPGRRHAGFFAQGDLGMHFILDREHDETHYLFLAGLRGGYRLPLGTAFYLEPYGRVGYPFVFGLGLMAGMRFKNKTK